MFKRDKQITTIPQDWPQGRFNSKACRHCGAEFSPQSPCHLYCSDDCAASGKTSAYLKRKYGIDYSDYQRMLEDQNHKCKVCGGDGFKLKETQNLLLVVDHCHDTGNVRGLLCHNCNRGIGLLQDSVSNLESAIKYLEGSTTIPKGSTAKRLEAPSPGDG
jgi:hypothetical protein